MSKITYKRETIYDIDFKSIVRTHLYATAITNELADFRLRHTDRVEILSGLLAEYYHKNNEVDLRKVKIMAIVHDMFKYSSIESTTEYDNTISIKPGDDHGYRASLYLSCMVEPFLQVDLSKEQDGNSKADVFKEIHEWNMVCSALHFHSMKDASDTSDNPYLAILQDADMLDKITIGYTTSIRSIFASNKTFDEIFDSNLAKISKYTGKSIGYDEVLKLLIKRGI